MLGEKEIYKKRKEMGEEGKVTKKEKDGREK
jgi:hypothetical protein